MKNTLLGLAGTALFAFLIAKIGWVSIVPLSKTIWLGLPLILVLSLVRLVLQTASWATALRREGIATSTMNLIGIRLASQGMGYITPLGPAASEPMKIRLLAGQPANAAVATLVDTGTYWFTSALFGIAACVGAGLMLAQSRVVTLLLLSLAATLIAGVALIAQPRPLLTMVAQLLGTRAPGWLNNGVRVEHRIRTFAARQPQTMRKMLWLDLACQILVAAEVAVVLWVLRIPLHVGTILALEAANRGVKVAAGWMPGRVGADEGAAAGTFLLLGLPSASGLALALTRRVRDLVACAFGLGWLVCNGWLMNNDTTIKEAALCRP